MRRVMSSLRHRITDTPTATDRCSRSLHRMASSDGLLMEVRFTVTVAYGDSADAFLWLI